MLVVNGKVARGTPMKERLEHYTYIEPNTGCWLWLGSLNNKGYGKVTLATGKSGGYTSAAHRLSWTEFKGEIPTGINVLHKCDTPSCINPDHLFLGSYKDNSQDCIQKGRWKCVRYGEACNMSRLNSEQVKWIRNNKGKLLQSEIARRFGVHQSVISRIVNGQNWRHVR